MICTSLGPACCRQQCACHPPLPGKFPGCTSKQVSQATGAREPAGPGLGCVLFLAFQPSPGEGILRGAPQQMWTELSLLLPSSHQRQARRVAPKSTPGGASPGPHGELPPAKGGAPGPRQWRDHQVRGMSLDLEPYSRCSGSGCPTPDAEHPGDLEGSSEAHDLIGEAKEQRQDSW